MNRETVIQRQRALRDMRFLSIIGRGDSFLSDVRLAASFIVQGCICEVVRVCYHAKRVRI